jgi:hypothetical protein
MATAATFCSATDKLSSAHQQIPTTNLSSNDKIHRYEKPQNYCQAVICSGAA